MEGGVINTSYEICTGSWARRGRVPAGVDPNHLTFLESVTADIHYLSTFFVLTFLPSRSVFRHSEGIFSSSFRANT